MRLGFVLVDIGLALGAILFSVRRDCIKFLKFGDLSASGSASPLVYQRNMRSRRGCVPLPDPHTFGIIGRHSSKTSAERYMCQEYHDQVWDPTRTPRRLQAGLWETGRESDPATAPHSREDRDIALPEQLSTIVEGPQSSLIVPDCREHSSLPLLEVTLSSEHLAHLMDEQ